MSHKFYTKPVTLPDQTVRYYVYMRCKEQDDMYVGESTNQIMANSITKALNDKSKCRCHKVIRASFTIKPKHTCDFFVKTTEGCKYKNK